MSAIVCRKRSFFEDSPTPAPTPLYKKYRCSSPIRYSQTGSSAKDSLIRRLFAAFPLMDEQVIERVLDECGDDLDIAIGRLNDLCLASDAAKLNELSPQPETQVVVDGEFHGDGGSKEDQLDQNTLPTDGAQWVELFVSEMRNASNLDDARGRASRALEALEKSIMVRAGAEAAQRFHQENDLLKEQMQALVQENTVLKRAVAILHERQKDYSDKTQELQHLKELIPQYQQQLSALEVKNYALAMHVKQAQQNSTIPGRFNPDVF